MHIFANSNGNKLNFKYSIVMKKKNYIKPCMYTYEIETAAILAGSGGQPTTKPVSDPQNFSVNDDVTSGDNDDVWE